MPLMPSNKVILTNKQAMRRKYGASGWGAIEAAIDELVTRDSARGITTTLIALDSVNEMRRYAAAPVIDHLAPAENKRAVDGVYASLEPDYLVLLGSPDTLPHQPLSNPLHADGDDPDSELFSDLPYACDAPFSLNVEDFKAPTRVVGRLPDINGDRDPQYLVGLLERASRWRRSPEKDYRRYFGVTAEVWRGSSRRSVQRIFGALSGLKYVPPEGPSWPDDTLSAKSHFFNLHGAQDDPSYYGESQDAFPVAHSAILIGGKIRVGTVAAAECCYGAELYNPRDARTLPGLCNTYLREGGYAFFGSTTIAYGPADKDGAADFICQDFIRFVLQGASVGRAALQARQQFVTRAAPLSPVDLKTLGQFCLLAEPSIHPVSMPAIPRSRSLLRSSESTRIVRRRALIRRGMKLARSIAGAGSRPDAGLHGATRDWIRRRLADRRLTVTTPFLSFAIHAPRDPPRLRSIAAQRRAQGGGAFHLAFAESEYSPTDRRPSAKIVLVAKEVDGHIEELREYHPR